ncbi:MAG: hypothetical protein ACREU7_16290, partial [Burkholderiales bacterium]
MILVLVGVALALGGCRSQKVAADPAAKTEAAPVEVRVARAVERPLERTIEIVGSLVARESADLSFEVAGRLVSI